MSEPRIPRPPEIHIDWQALRAVRPEREPDDDRRVKRLCRFLGIVCLAGGLALIVWPLLPLVPQILAALR